MSVDPDYTSWQRKQRQPVLNHLTALTTLSCTGEGLFAVQADEVNMVPELLSGDADLHSGWCACTCTANTKASWQD